MSDTTGLGKRKRTDDISAVESTNAAASASAASADADTAGTEALPIAAADLQQNNANATAIAIEKALAKTTEEEDEEEAWTRVMLEAGLEGVNPTEPVTAVTAVSDVATTRTMTTASAAATETSDALEQGRKYLLRLTFVNPDALHKWALTTAKKTPTALLKFVSDPTAPFHGVVMECREKAASDNVALVSQFKCAVEGGLDARGDVVTRDTIDNDFEFVINTEELVKCIAAVKEKSALLTATIYTEITSDERVIQGLDAGLVWECFGAAGESCSRWSQPIRNAAEIREAMPDLGDYFDHPKMRYPVEFGVSVPPLIQLFKAANGAKATDVTLTLSEARAPPRRSSEGSLFLEVRHCSLQMSFNTTLTPLPLSKTLFVTMGTLSAERREHIVDVSDEERAQLNWTVVCKNAYAITTLLSFLVSCGSEAGHILITNGEARNRQPFNMSVDCGDESGHFLMVGPSCVVDETM